eukprot:1455990-Rhodomonas_salina.1
MRASKPKPLSPLTNMQAPSAPPHPATTAPRPAVNDSTARYASRSLPTRSFSTHEGMLLPAFCGTIASWLCSYQPCCTLSGTDGVCATTRCPCNNTASSYAPSAPALQVSVPVSAQATTTTSVPLYPGLSTNMNSAVYSPPNVFANIPVAPQSPGMMMPNAAVNGFIVRTLRPARCSGVEGATEVGKVLQMMSKVARPEPESRIGRPELRRVRMMPLTRPVMMTMTMMPTMTRTRTVLVCSGGAQWQRGTAGPGSLAAST